MLKTLRKVLVALTVVVALIPQQAAAQYTEKDIYAYIEQYKDIAIKKMQEYKIPASITIAQGIFESACGKSRLAVDGNNHFGIKCHQDWTGDTILIDDDELQECFRKYNSVEDSYNDHSLFLKNRKRYENLFKLELTDYAAWARTLKADGYATNPKYADQLISIIERFRIARLDTLYLEQYCGYHKEVVANAEVVSKPTPVSKPDVASQTKPVSKQDVAAKPAQASKPEMESKPATPSTGNASMKVFVATIWDYPTVSSPFTHRKVYQNNKTYFVIAQRHDTYESIAADVQMNVQNLRKFNDAQADKQPVENEVVYIESKSKTGMEKAHKVSSGETLRYIAQRYAVQLEYIFKYNNLDENSVIHPGDQILLRH